MHSQIRLYATGSYWPAALGMTVLGLTLTSESGFSFILPNIKYINRRAISRQTRPWLIFSLQSYYRSCCLSKNKIEAGGVTPIASAGTCVENG